MLKALDELKNEQLSKIIAVKFGYVLGLFTVIYFVTLAYALIFGLNPASTHSALIITVIAIGITAIDIILLKSDKATPALVAMVLWVSPFYMLYKLFKHTELFNLNSTYLARRIKQYLTFSYLPHRLQ